MTTTDHRAIDQPPRCPGRGRRVRLPGARRRATRNAAAVADAGCRHVPRWLENVLHRWGALLHLRPWLAGGLVFAALAAKEIGIILAVAVFLDALCIRLIVAPVVLRLTGPAAWPAPRWLARILPDVRFSHQRPRPTSRERSTPRRSAQ